MNFLRQVYAITAKKGKYSKGDRIIIQIGTGAKAQFWVTTVKKVSRNGQNIEVLYDDGLSRTLPADLPTILGKTKRREKVLDPLKKSELKKWLKKSDGKIPKRPEQEHKENKEKKELEREKVSKDPVTTKPKRDLTEREQEQEILRQLRQQEEIQNREDEKREKELELEEQREIQELLLEQLEKEKHYRRAFEWDPRWGERIDFDYRKKSLIKDNIDKHFEKDDHSSFVFLLKLGTSGSRAKYLAAKTDKFGSIKLKSASYGGWLIVLRTRDKGTLNRIIELSHDIRTTNLTVLDAPLLRALIYNSEKWAQASGDANIRAWNSGNSANAKWISMKNLQSILRLPKNDKALQSQMMGKYDL